jgi:hypothetical protein
VLLLLACLLALAGTTLSLARLLLGAPILLDLGLTAALSFAGLLRVGLMLLLLPRGALSLTWLLLCALILLDLGLTALVLAFAGLARVALLLLLLARRVLSLARLPLGTLGLHLLLVRALTTLALSGLFLDTRALLLSAFIAFVSTAWVLRVHHRSPSTGDGGVACRTVSNREARETR